MSFSFQALQAQALQLMALGVANAQNVVPAMANVGPVVSVAAPVVSNTQQQQQQAQTATIHNNVNLLNNVTRSLALMPTTAASPLVMQVDPTSIAESSTKPTSTSIQCGQENNGNIHQKLMEQLTNNVTKNINCLESDFNNEELIEFMRLVGQCLLSSSYYSSVGLPGNFYYPAWVPEINILRQIVLGILDL